MPDFLNNVEPRIRRLYKVGQCLEILYIMACITGVSFVLLFDIHSVWTVALILLLVGGLCIGITRQITRTVRQHVLRQGDHYAFLLEELISEVSGRVYMPTIERPEIMGFQELAQQKRGPLSQQEIKLLHMLNRCPETTVVPVLESIFRHLLGRVRSEPAVHGDLLKKLYNRWAFMPYEKKLNAIVLGEE